MSTGGIFQLITNDGKQDRMLMASQLLMTRLVEIRRMRAAAGVRDPTPTLVDIERTHVLFMNAHFKPFAAIGYEYNKTRVQSGTASFGSTIQFSIPQFGDFFHDMVIQFKITKGVASGATYADRWQWADFLGERLCKKTKFSVNGNPLDEYDSTAMKFHETYYVTPNKRTGWNRLVGQEQCKEGSLSLPSTAPVNSLCGADQVVHIDESVDDPASDPAGVGASPDLRQCVSYKNGLQTAKRTHEGFELWVPLLFWFNKDPRLAIPSVSIPYGQRFIDVELETLANLARTSYDPVLGDISTGSSGSAVTWATTPTISDATLYINNIFVNPEIHDIFIKRIGFNLIRVHRIQTNRLNKSSDEVLLNQLKWPVETIYAGIRPSENNRLQTGTANNVMENWHRFAGIDDSRRVKASVCGNPLVEARTLDVGAVTDAAADAPLQVTIVQAGTPGLNEITRVQVAAASALAQSGTGTTLTLRRADDTDVGFYFNVDGNNTAPGATVDVAVDVSANDDVGAVAAALAAAIASDQFTSLLAEDATTSCSYARFKECFPVVDSLSINAHGIPIYNDIPHQFFNSYTSYTYGGHHINTPEDCGTQMITFNLYPGSYQPSGHINISRAREFYYKYSSAKVPVANSASASGDCRIGPLGGASARNTGDDWVSSSNTADLLIVAISINFLLISDGSAVLRYST